MWGVGEPASAAALCRGDPPLWAAWLRGLGRLLLRREKSLQAFWKGPLGDDFWSGVGWEGVQLDTELLLGAGGAEGLGMFWGGGRQT